VLVLLFASLRLYDMATSFSSNGMLRIQSMAAAADVIYERCGIKMTRDLRNTIGSQHYLCETALLQRMIHAAALCVLDLKPRDHVTTALMPLHD
jgi:hypothetical protein